MTEIPMGNTPAIPMGDIPAYYAERRGFETCLTYPEGSLTWEQLEQNSNRLARAFADLGVEQDDLVTVALPNGLAFHETMFAVWKLGATPHVVSSALTRQEIIEIVELANPKLAIGFEEGLVTGRPAIGSDFSAADYSDTPIEAKVATHWRAMSSGGSTGRPKIIVEHNPSLWGFSFPLVNFPENHCVLNPGPLYHSGPFAWSHIALFQGNHLVGMRRFDASEALVLIEKHRVNWVQMVPTMMHRIWKLRVEEKQRHDLGSLKTVLHMAAPMPVWLKEKWIAWLGAERILELYGGTEAIGVTIISGEEWLAHKGSVGKTVAGVIKILDDEGNECSPGTPGNVCFETPVGAEPQYHYIGAKAMRIAKGWETLGDMGWMDSEGYLYLADRKTDMIISGGANIYPAEVEAALLEHPGVDTAVVIGMPHEDLGQAVHAIVHPLAEWWGRLDEEQMRAFMEQRLVRYKTPRTYEFVDHKLRDDAGKTRRSRLVSERTNG